MDATSYGSKYNMQILVKALVHFSIFFTAGFIAAFVPHSNISILSDPFLRNPFAKSGTGGLYNNNTHFVITKHEPDSLVIVITTTRSGDKFEPIALTRLAHSLETVPPSLLWIVVEAEKKHKTTAEMLRSTKVMNRHLTYRDNFTVPGAEIDHQRNLALRYIQLHHLAAIVHFTDASVIYDAMFFEEMRKIKMFGVWAVASVGLNRRKVIVNGPVCQGSEITGWFSKDASSKRNPEIASLEDIKGDASKINVFGFGFNSSILWDPDSLSRTKSTTNTTKEFVEFVMEEATRKREEGNISIHSECSRVMLWHLHIPRSFVNPFQA